jgi:hypothetical protein
MGGVSGDARCTPSEIGPGVGGAFSGICTARACTSTVANFKGCFQGGTTFAKIQASVFQACWRDQCWSDKYFADVSYTPGQTIPTVGVFATSNTPTPTFELEEFSDGSFALTTRWAVRDSTNFEHTDGDVFKYSVRDVDGNLLVSEEAAVRWETYNPNPGCPPSVPSTMCLRRVMP